MATLLFISLAPVVVIFTLIWLLDREREPLLRLIAAFSLGVFSALPVVLVEMGLSDSLGVTSEGSAGSVFLYALVVIAFTEEFFKFLPVRLAMYPSRAFNEAYDGIMYCAASALGFAAIENILYVVQYGLGTGVLRAVTAVPGHAMYGVIVGYFMGHSKLFESRWQRFRLMATGLLISTVLHGLYDFFLFRSEGLTVVMALVVHILALVLGIRAIRAHRRRQAAALRDLPVIEIPPPMPPGPHA